MLWVLWITIAVAFYLSKVPLGRSKLCTYVPYSHVMFCSGWEWKYIRILTAFVLNVLPSKIGMSNLKYWSRLCVRDFDADYALCSVPYCEVTKEYNCQHYLYPSHFCVSVWHFVSTCSFHFIPRDILCVSSKLLGMILVIYLLSVMCYFGTWHAVW